MHLFSARKQIAEHSNFAKLIRKTHSILIFCALDQCILRCLPFTLIGGFQLTSWWPCCWMETEDFLSAGNETLFSCKFYEIKFHCFAHQHSCLVTWLKTSSNKGDRFSIKPNILTTSKIQPVVYYRYKVLIG